MLRIEGMTCASCSLAVRFALMRLEGVRKATVRYAEKRAVVEYDPAMVKPEQMVDAVNRLGYRATVVADRSLRTSVGARETARACAYRRDRG
jgi:Cu+-exporting ATPase